MKNWNKGRFGFWFYSKKDMRNRDAVMARIMEAQGSRKERERIIERIKAQICFDALADQEGRCSNHSGKCYELGLLIQELTTGQIAAVKECEHLDLKHTDSSAHLAFCPDCDLEFSCECEAKEIK